MAIMELNKIPCVFLFSEYLDRIAKVVSNVSMRQSVMMLVQHLMSSQPVKKRASFFELATQSLAQHVKLPKEQQEAIEQQCSPIQHLFSVFAQHLNPEDLMMMAQIIQKINAEGSTMSQDEVNGYLQNMRQAQEDLLGKMAEGSKMLLIMLLLLMLLPELLVGMMRERLKVSKTMAKLFEKVLVRVRESGDWWDYWKVRCDTLRVVNDSLSWKEIMNEERIKEREELGKVPGGLFAKWTTDRKAFDADFLDVSLSDDALRSFIFHLTTLYEIARELDPTTKFGTEQLVRNETQQVGDAVLEAACKLQDLTSKAWFPHYESMWQELIGNEKIFAHLKVTRKSPHNNLFTARFFCHLVGEMKKSAVFGSHSDSKLAERLTDKRYVGTFRKNIQEGLGNESENIRFIFDAIFKKYKDLVHQK